MRFILGLATLLLTLSTSFVHADTREHEDAELARYSKYAQPAVDYFYMYDMWRWQVVGSRKVLIWPNIHEIYLVTVDKGCIRLEWARGLSVTQAMRWKVSKTFDFVDFDRQHCKIEQIEPIDWKAMRADAQGK